LPSLPENKNLLFAAQKQFLEPPLSINESAASELTTIYAKYKVSEESLSQVFAVMWLKTAKKFVLGLAAPEKIRHKDIIDASME
jgi:hypothetical protein